MMSDFSIVCLLWLLRHARARARARSRVDGLLVHAVTGSLPFVFLHHCGAPGRVGRGSWPTKTPLANRKKTYLLAFTLRRCVDSWGMLILSIHLHFIWCCAIPGVWHTVVPNLGFTSSSPSSSSLSSSWAPCGGTRLGLGPLGQHLEMCEYKRLLITIVGEC